MSMISGNEAHVTLNHIHAYLAKENSNDLPTSCHAVRPMAPKLKFSESTHFYRHFDTTYGTMFAQKGKAEEIGKGKVRFVCRSYRIFG